MNKLSKRLGAVGLAAALAFTFMPASALAATTTGTIKKGEVTVSDTDNYDPDNAEISIKGIKKLYLSNVGFDDGGETGAVTETIGVVAAKKIGKKTYYLRVDDGNLKLIGNDYELDLMGNKWDGDIEIYNGAGLKVSDSKLYKKETVKGDYDKISPDGYNYKISRDKNFGNTNASTVAISATTYIDGDKDNGKGYDPTKLYGGYNLKTVPDSGKIGGTAFADKDQGTKFHVGELGGTITVGKVYEDKWTKGTLTLNDNDEIVDKVIIANGTFTQNGGWVNEIESNADSDSSLDTGLRTTAKVNINKTSGSSDYMKDSVGRSIGEDIEDLASAGDSLKKGETVKIKSGTFIGDNPAKLGTDETNTINNVAEVGTFTTVDPNPNVDGDEYDVPVFTVAPSDVSGYGFALNGAVTCTAKPLTDFRIATVKNPFDTETATAGTTLKAKAAKNTSYAVITNKITYTDILETKENANQVSYDTHIIADGGYEQQSDNIDPIKGTYEPIEESGNRIWQGGTDASQPNTKKNSDYEDKDGELGRVINELETVEADDVTGNAGIVKDGFTYERSIELYPYPQDTFDALTGLSDNNVDTDKGITYFTKDPSAYAEESHGIAVIDGEKWIISGDASDFEKGSELAAVAGKAEKSIDIKKVDGYLKDDNKIDNAPSGVAFDLNYKLADTLKIGAPADVVVASTLNTVNSNLTDGWDNFYTVYVYGLDANLGAASDFGVDLEPVELQDITFTVRQVPAKASVVVTDIAKGVDVETATGIEYYALYDSADATEADYVFGATDDVIAELHKGIEGAAAEFNSGVVYVSDGIEGSFVKVPEAVDIKADDASRYTKTANAEAGYNDWNVTADVALYRVYNPNSGEHVFITKADQAEVDMLVAYGWTNEGIKWKAPKSSELAVYRAYNPNSGLHYYTANKGEYDYLVSIGWSQDKGVAFYSAAATAAPIYCEYNEADGSHNYTADKAEHDFLLANGWKENAVTFYGIK